MFKFCVLPNNETQNGNSSVYNNSESDLRGLGSERQLNESRELRTSEIMKQMNMSLHEKQLSELNDLNGGANQQGHMMNNMSMVGNINHMPQMSNMEQQHGQQFVPHHLQQSTGLAKYVSSLNQNQNNQNIAPPLLQNYSHDDSYFLTQLENEEEIPFQESLDFD
eukprot:UN08646